MGGDLCPSLLKVGGLQPLLLPPLYRIKWNFPVKVTSKYSIMKQSDEKSMKILFHRVFIAWLFIAWHFLSLIMFNFMSTTP